MYDFYKITLPPEDFTHVEYGMNEFPPLWEIHHKSSIKHRRILESFAHYFHREQRFDFCQYDAKEKDLYKAWLFSQKYFRWVGGICFRPRNYKDEGKLWSLDWVWVHPYYRNRGLLTKHWPFFKEHFKTFMVSWPLSSSMESFLIRHNDSSVFVGDKSLCKFPEYWVFKPGHLTFRDTLL